jgi:hypothetical protein
VNKNRNAHEYKNCFETYIIFQDIHNNQNRHYAHWVCSQYWFIVYSFTSRSKIFHLYGDVAITGEWLQNLGLCSVLKAFEQGGILIVPHLLWHGPSVFLVSSEVPPHLVAFYDTQGNVEISFSPGSSWVWPVRARSVCMWYCFLQCYSSSSNTTCCLIRSPKRVWLSVLRGKYYFFSNVSRPIRLKYFTWEYSNLNNITCSSVYRL